MGFEFFLQVYFYKFAARRKPKKEEEDKKTKKLSYNSSKTSHSQRDYTSSPTKKKNQKPNPDRLSMSSTVHLSLGFSFHQRCSSFFQQSVAMALSLVHSTLFSKTSQLFLHTKTGFSHFSSSIPFSSSALPSNPKTWRRPVISVLELGGVKIARDGINYVLLSIFLLQCINGFSVPFSLFHFCLVIIPLFTAVVQSSFFSLLVVDRCLFCNM
jgi:hypothetical protein